MATFRTLIWRAVGRSTLLTRALRRIAPSPFRFIAGKPLERWLLTYDLGRRSLALANDPAVVEAVMQDRTGAFPKSAALGALLRPLIGAGVFGQPGGPEVRETRKLYSRALAAIPDEVVVEVTRTVTERYFQRWLRSGALERLPFCTEMSRMTVDIVALCTLGATFDPEESERFAELFFEYHQRAVPLLLLPVADDSTLHAHIVDHMELATIGSAMRMLIRDRFVTPLLTGDHAVRAAPFATQLIEAGLLNPTSDTAERAVDEIAVMLLAGHETTASVLSWLFWELARSPERQAAIASLLPAEDHEAVASEEADQAAQALIKEALRLYPPIAFFLRDADKPTTFRGKPILKGSFFVIAPWTLHRHRKLWEAPDEFRPERWQGQGPGCPRAAYIPFGMGPRTCPGARFAELEAQQIVRLLLGRFRFTPSMSDQPEPLGSLTSRPDREIYLSLTRRVNEAEAERDEPRCPITGEAPQRRIQLLRRSLLRSLWRVGTGIDVARLFPGHTPLGLYESNHGLLFFHPAIEGDARFYSEFYSRVDMHERLIRELLSRVEYRRAARHVRPGDRVLDIGCGVGAFRAHVPDARFLGLDPFAPAEADSLVLREDAEQHCRAHPATYDVVTAFQVIEHLAQPRRLVASMVEALKPGGLLILCAPLHPSPMTALPNFLLNAPPHHLSWWNRPAFEALAGHCGLEVIELAELGASPHEGMIHWMERLCASKTAYDRDGRYFAHRWDWHLSLGLAWGLAHLAHRIRALPPRSRPVSVLLVARKPGQALDATP
ncbi:cytochrome P450 [Methylotetracoccus oryzae]|uniref:cytochrome P450 n=1 Tax=Methylotetracoccus oryzae TaxID=1919059 RepID=UPI00111B4C8E|nr:cytochrome P450 [Methylotetracoccus oryzae]